MATWFEIIYTGEPTDADYERVAILAAQGYTSGQLLNEEDDPADECEGAPGPMHEHDGYQPHSHEVRADHLGVAKP